MTSWLAANLRKPEGIGSWFTIRLMKNKNWYLEKSAVKLCKIEPDHNVLELGFGPGIGLTEALKCVAGGSGRVYGMDYSNTIVTNAISQFSSEIEAGKLQLTIGDVHNLQYKKESMDRIFHCNCYYFWNDKHKILTDLFEILKVGACMVTCLNMDSLQMSHDRGVITKDLTNPEEYMEALKACNFQDVCMEEMTYEEGNLKYQAIFAYKR